MLDECKQATLGPKGVGWLRHSAGRIALVISALCIAALALLLPITVDAPRGAATDAGSKVIIAIDPARRSQLYWFLRTVLGKVKGEKIGQTQSEVWAVPTSQLARLALILRVFGSKLTRHTRRLQSALQMAKGLRHVGRPGRDDERGAR